MKTQTKTEQKEIGKIKLSDNEELVATLINCEKLDLRIWMHTEKYNGPTKKGIRFYLFDNNWEEFKKLIDKINKIYQKL